MDPRTPGRTGGTREPQTPKGQIMQQTMSPASPLTPRNQTNLYGKFREIAAMVATEENDTQRKAIVENLLKYSQKLAEKHGVKIGDKSGDKPTLEQEANDLGDFVVNDQPAHMVAFMAGGNNTLAETAQRDPIFAPITLAISPVWDVAAMTRMRAKFFHCLTGMEFTVEKNRVKQVQKFSQDDAVAITNFFFTDVLGEKAVGRLTKIVNYYQTDHPGGLDKGAGTRALLALEIKDLPVEIKEFMRSFSRAKGAINNAPKEFTSVAQYIMDIQLVNSFTDLKAAAENKNASLIQFLVNKGYVTSRGVDYKTLVIRYVADAMAVPRTTLANTCQSALGIRALYMAFGSGVLTLLPPGSETKLNVWGNQRMSHVYTLLKQEAYCIQPVCDMLKTHLILPTLNGKSLTISPLKGGAKESSLLEKVQEAVAEHGEAADGGLQDDGTGETEWLKDYAEE